MEFPEKYKYSKEHTWLKLIDNQQALIGITEFAQNELGEIVFVELPQIVDTSRKMKFLDLLKQ